MKRREFLTAALSVATAFATRSARAQPANSKRAAVVIGVNKAGKLPQLKAARSGARSVEQWLRGEGFEVKLFVDDPNPVKADDIFAAIKSFVDRGTVEQLVIYFAGHGFISGSISEFWLLSEAPDNPNQAVSLTESRAYAKQSGIPNVVFISDACRSRADSLRAERIHGSVVFPNEERSSRVEVDTFLATSIGSQSWEVQHNPTEFEGIYTASFLDAFKRPYPEMILTVDGSEVVPNRRLTDYLAREVPKRAQAASIKLNQAPDADVCSNDRTYIGHVLSTARLVAPPPSATPRLSDVASAAVGVPIGGGRPPSQLLGGPTRPTPSDAEFDRARGAIVLAQDLPGRLTALTGFTVFGQNVKSVTARSGIKIRFSNSTADRRASALIEIDSEGVRAASVAIRFANDSGTVVAALDQYVGSVVVDEGRVSNVSYVPSRQSSRWSVYEQEAPRLEELRAAVAASARLGVFRIEGPRESRIATAAQLAERTRIFKSIDPTLGLYAAYAYADAGLVDNVHSVRAFMRSGLGDIDLFDVVMLSGELSGRTPANPGGPYPFCPLLSQGWALLRVCNVRLNESVLAARDHLRHSLWTTLDPDGMDIVEKGLREGRVT